MNRKEMEKILKRMDQRYNILLELCKMMGMDIEELEKKADERYAKAV